MTQQVDREQLDHERRVAEQLDVGGAEAHDERMARQAHQADGDAEHAREDDAGEGDPQRVGHADRERAQVAVARGVLEEQLADVEAGGIAQEAEARLDLARLEVGADVVRQADDDGDEDQRERALDDDRARPLGAAARAPGGVADGRRRRAQRIGGAYIRPPLVHRLLTPRGRATGVFGPRFLSKLSP